MSPQNKIISSEKAAVKLGTDKYDTCESYTEVCSVDANSIEDIAVLNEVECIDYNTYVDTNLDEVIEL